MRIKTAAIEVKSADGLVDGEFTGYASVFDTTDSYGDVVRKGAFTESLKAYGDGGSGIPCYWGHRMDEPMMNLGVTKSAVEDDHGLLVHVRLDTENERAAYVHKLIKEGRVRQMSFAYAVTEGAYVEQKDGDPFYEIRAADIFEVSVVPVGANPQAELTGVKAALLASGHPLVKTDDLDRLRQIRDLADAILSDTEKEAPEVEEGEPSPDETEGEKHIQNALAKLAQLNLKEN